MPNIYAIFKALFASPFLLIGNLFLGIANLIIGEENTEYDDEKLARKYAKKITAYIWFIFILGILAIGIREQ